MLNIHAKMERKSDDGSRFYQEVSREYLLPETLKVDELKSVFNDDGVCILHTVMVSQIYWYCLFLHWWFFDQILRIEAPLPETEKPREIPIDRCDVPKKELDPPKPELWRKIYMFIVYLYLVRLNFFLFLYFVFSLIYYWIKIEYRKDEK